MTIAPSDFRSGSAPQVFFDPGYDAIDGDFVFVNGVNYLYFKKNTDGALLGARSDSWKPGSFSVYTSGISPGRGVEAPQICKSATGNVWYMWGDTWSPNGRFFCWQTTDVARGSWSLLGDRAYTQPLNSKHCGPDFTAQEIVSRLQAASVPSTDR